MQLMQYIDSYNDAFISCGWYLFSDESSQNREYCMLSGFSGSFT